MNANLQERFGRSRNAFSNETHEALEQTEHARVNPRIRQYFEGFEPLEGERPWLQRPELPSESEVLDVDGADTEVVELHENRPEGTWESRDTYLETQYELLREDAVRWYREDVLKIRKHPKAHEDLFEGSIGIYDKVHICGLTCSTRGIATRVTFSLIRANKKIIWQQSNRLRQDSLVLLTPSNDMFQSQAIVATVAARPLSGLELNPPEVDLIFARSEEQEIDPAKEFVMIEHRGSMYEASRHTLLGLQRLYREPFPLSEHIIGVQSGVLPPDYLKEQPSIDLTQVYARDHYSDYAHVDVLNEWPEVPSSNLDESQTSALRRMLTRRLAIIQGPPGTGKTHVSEKALRILFENRKAGDPPIIIASQTNHAVDQILRLVAQFEPNFVRLGSRSKDGTVVRPRTIYELRKICRGQQPIGSIMSSVWKPRKDLTKEIKTVLEPMLPNDQPLDADRLQSFGILTDEQARSLKGGARGWIRDPHSSVEETGSPFRKWLRNALVAVPQKQMPEDFSFEFEEADLESEELEELEAENATKEDDEAFTLSGDTFSVADNFTCHVVTDAIEPKIRKLLATHVDLWKIKVSDRPAVYRFLQAEQKKKILDKLRPKFKEFNDIAKRQHIGTFEKNETILKNSNIIGMTTSGLSKNRGLISALEPRIILVEEAAETLEAPVAVACLPSLQQLILVGDHEQLRPHCNVPDLENHPFFLNISLFERLIRNKLEFDSLRRQRRMIPEVRRCLQPIYGDLILDHHSVLDPLNRPDVPGMGGVNSFFFTHKWSDRRDELMSCINLEEAEMIVGFVEYLVYNDMDPEDITILTFYNGQRKLLLKELRNKPSLAGHRFKVVTVDSYQGEENKVIILSLVRSNDMGKIGFLDVGNRVCVALSRAQCGFYIFGNGELLYRVNVLWHQVIKIIANQGSIEKDRLLSDPKCRIGEILPVKCSNHGNMTEIRTADDWNTITGGCQKESCSGRLLCGHPCSFRCHPFEHERVICQKNCTRVLQCGHPCQKRCGEKCTCIRCNDLRTDRTPLNSAMITRTSDNHEAPMQRPGVNAWMTYAADEPRLYAAAAAAAAIAGTRASNTAFPAIDASAAMQANIPGGDLPTHQASPSNKLAKRDHEDEIILGVDLIDLDETSSQSSPQLPQLKGVLIDIE